MTGQDNVVQKLLHKINTNGDRTCDLPMDCVFIEQGILPGLMLIIVESLIAID